LIAGALSQVAEPDWLNWSHDKDYMLYPSISGTSLPYNLKP